VEHTSIWLLQNSHLNLVMQDREIDYAVEA
jgi:hypothetical protein